MGNAYTGALKLRMPAEGDYSWHDEWWDNQEIQDVVQGGINSKNRVISGGVVTDGGGLLADAAECVVYVGGNYHNVSAIAGVALTAPPPEGQERKNWIYIDNAGALVVSVVAPTGDYVPLALVDVSDSAVLRIADLRPHGYGDPEVLSAIDKVLSGITGTVTRVFRYDPSKDSDRGAWREFCSHLPWYWEELNTATRGRTRKFPADSLIVTELDKVTIFDLTKSDCPMWMVFSMPSEYSSTTSRILGYVTVGQNANFSGLYMLNGVLCIGTRKTDYTGFIGSLSIVSFIKDSAKRVAHSNYNASYPYLVGVWRAGIKNRNADLATGGYDGTDVGIIAAAHVEAIAMTIIDDAPIDPETGIAVPTIGVATDDGVSVIDGPAGVGTVDNFGVGNKWFNLTFTPDNLRIQGTRGTTGSAYPYATFEYIDILTGAITQYVTPLPSHLPGVATPGSLCVGGHYGNTTGLSSLYENPTAPEKGSVAHITKTYNTGIMQGDIRLAALCDTVAGYLGTNLWITPDEVDTGWTDNGDGTYTCDGSTGFLRITNALVGFDSKSLASMLTVDSISAGEVTLPYDGSGPNRVSITSTGDFVHTFKSVVNSSHAYVYSNGFNGTISLVSLKEAIEDRSVKNNPLQVVGTITKSPVATGAELQAFSGFSETDYIEQAYNSDLDFGTGDFHIMLWANSQASGPQQTIVSREDREFSLEFLPTSGILRAYALNSSNSLIYFDSLTSLGHDVNTHICVVFSGGVGSIYFNGVLNSTGPMAYDIDSASGDFTVGIRKEAGVVNPDTPAVETILSLVRTGAGAPTDEQILEIYNKEKHLFQENAKCTLQGDSSDVKALYHDKDQDLLYAGTGDGVTVFKDLLAIDHLQDGVDVVSLASGKGAHFIASASEVNAYVPETDLREEMARLSEQTKTYGGPLEDFWFTGDASETDFTLPHGWKAKHVYDAGLIQRPDSGYTISFDGYAHTISFAVAPGSGSDVCVLAQREV